MMVADESKIILNFLHDRRKDENRLIVDFLIEKRWFWQVVKLGWDRRGVYSSDAKRGESVSGII
jgi:hypothetical protein